MIRKCLYFLTSLLVVVDMLATATPALAYGHWEGKAVYGTIASVDTGGQHGHDRAC